MNAIPPLSSKPNINTIHESQCPSAVKPPGSGVT
jgi:hypothetical protein